MTIISNISPNGNIYESEEEELEAEVAETVEKTNDGDLEALKLELEALKANMSTQDVATFDKIETDDFSLIITHEATVGDLLISVLLAVNAFVLVLARAIKGGGRSGRH